MLLRRRSTQQKPEVPDPRKFRVSPHFLLSDFLGCHSVYTKGYPNAFEINDTSPLKLDNLKCLCALGLEPLLERYGPMSIGYGHISPYVSKQIVKYQASEKPSHHRFDLGAAVDFISHRWVAGEFKLVEDYYLPPSVTGSPIALAHAIDQSEMPYSRLITYSESPYICLALSAREYVQGYVRRMFYENRFNGLAKAKPDYRTYSTSQAKSRAFEDLQERGLLHPWRGAGYPTYHGGGFRQLHHMRVSKYTMVTDWLFDLKSITNGAKNAPALDLDSVQDAFAAAGTVYDWLLDVWNIPRASIVEAYVHHDNPSLTEFNDWRKPEIEFLLATPEIEFGAGTLEPLSFVDDVLPDGVELSMRDGFLQVSLDVEKVLSQEWA